MSRRATSSSKVWLGSDRPVPLGKNRLGCLLVFFFATALSHSPRIAKQDIELQPLAQLSMTGPPLPRSQVRPWRRKSRICFICRVHPSIESTAVQPSIRHMVTNRVLRSVKVPIAERLKAPLSKCPPNLPARNAARCPSGDT